MNNASGELYNVQKALQECLKSVPFVRIEELHIQPSGYDIRPDILARVNVPDGEVVLLLDYRNNGQPRFARDAVNRIERIVRMFPRAYGVFAAPYISPRAAEICSERQIGYLDLAGNCRLSIWPFHIEKEGRPNPAATKRDLRSLYSPKATRILRVLLVQSCRSWKIQEMAAEANVSMGQVANVKKLLDNREWITSDSDGFRLTNPQALLAEWTSNYNFRRNKAYEFYSLKSIPEIESDLARICYSQGIKYALTGFSGGARYAPAVRYQRVTAYIEESGLFEVVSELGLKEVSSGANTTIMIPYDEGVFYGSMDIDGISVASAIQAYLDLLGFHGRGEEAATAVLRGAIEPKW